MIAGLVSHSGAFSSLLRNQGMIVARSFQNSRKLCGPGTSDGKRWEVFSLEATGKSFTAKSKKCPKSKLNGISPDEIIEEYGADSLRLYEMFMGPLRKKKSGIPMLSTAAAVFCRAILRSRVASDKVTDAERHLRH